MPSEDPHNHGPAQTGKNRPRIPLYLLPHLPTHAHTTLAPLLYRQLRQRKYHSCKHVYDDLLVDAALYATAEDEIPTCEAGEEGVEGFFFAGGRDTAEKDHCRFVGYREFGEVTRVGVGGLEDEGELVAEA